MVSAVDGMDAATVALWEECAAVGMPRAVAVTRLDHPRADFDETVALCQRVFGDNVLPLYLPMLGDDGESVAGLLGLITAARLRLHRRATRRPSANPIPSTCRRSRSPAAS